jgi:tetratricopeptide (TPR) repeat protein
MRPYREFLPLLSGSLFALLLLTFPVRAPALVFTPTNTEWASWPPYCQARYVVSAAGADGEFTNRVPQATVKAWQERLGDDVWYALHHYCAGIIIEARAKLEPDKKHRDFLRQNVLGEYRFTYDRIPASHPFRAEIAGRMALVYEDLGESENALAVVDKAIEECGTCASAWQAKAMLFRSQNKLEEARKVLEEGDRATEGKSAEINYFLGLVLLDLKDWDEAQARARKAYELGHPLPGLRDRLAKAGHPLK